MTPKRCRMYFPWRVHFASSGPPLFSIFFQQKSEEFYVLLRQNNDLQISSPSQSRQKNTNLGSQKRSKIDEILKKCLPKEKSKRCKKPPPRYCKTDGFTSTKHYFSIFGVSKTKLKIRIKTPLNHASTGFQASANSLQHIMQNTHASKITKKAECIVLRQ